VCIRTCCATPAGSRSPTKATTRDHCKPKNIQNTVIYTDMAVTRFKDWRA